MDNKKKMWIILGSVFGGLFLLLVVIPIIVSIVFVISAFNNPNLQKEVQNEQVSKQKDTITEQNGEKKLAKEIMDYGKKQYADGYKYVERIEVIDGFINIILNTDSKNLTDSDGSKNEDVIASIISKANFISCGEDNYYKDDNWESCNYNPRKINVFNKSGYHIHYAGMLYGIPLCFPPSYIEPKYTPKPYHKITETYRLPDFNKVYVGMSEKSLIQTMGKPLTLSTPRKGLKVFSYSPDCKLFDVYVENGNVSLIYDERKN